MKQVAILAMLATFGVASSASALTLTGGPVYSLPGGGSCTVSGITSQGSGATFSCTGINLASHTNVYVGIRNASNVNGNTMTGAAPTSGSAAVFRSSSTTANSITYTSTTTINSAIPAFGSDTVTSTLVLTRTAGTASVVSTGGNPGNNGNGDIGHVFRITGGSTLTLDVDVLASDPHFSGQACPAVFDPTHSSNGANAEISRVDIAFYYSDCGDGQTDSPEQCDQGAANGTAGSCCTTSCTFKPNGTACTDDGNVCTTDTCNGASATCQHPAGNAGSVCRASGGFCDIVETCTGSSPACPADAKSSVLCRASGGVCDPAEFCNGVNNNCPADAKSTAVCRSSAGACDVVEFCDGVNNDCPGDAIQGSGFVCNPGSGDLCDVDEHCDGVSTACPADTIASSGTLCRAGSGDSCDPAEFCTGAVDQPCPADVLQPNTTVCRPGSGDLCDPDEFCPGVSAGTCAAQVVAPAGTVCNPGSGDSCDPDELCSGNVGEACPSDTFEPASTTCRASGGACDIAESCPGTADGACPSDAKEPASTVCRAASDVCDQAENCNGSSNNCPNDLKKPNGTSCSDGFFCNGAEVCVGGTCSDQNDPCAFSAICNEGTDTCQTDTCAPAPLATCRTAQKSLLLLKNKPDTTGSDKLIWKFIKGAATTGTEFGNPTSTADYALCLYAGVSDTLVASINIPADPTRWTALGSKGYKYFDPTMNYDGIQKIVLKGTGVAGKTKALVKGAGINLPDPIDSIPLATPVTAQLVNYQTGICWTSEFNAFKKNTTAQFKAKN